MTTIETVGEVGPAGKLTIDVPQDVPQGRHRVLVVLDSEPAGSEPDTERRLAWEGNLLVFTGLGDEPLDVVREIERQRERRMIDVAFGSGE